ncbi:MAG: phospholipase D-like domain-containing protein [Oscillospiraceae bacterium]|jgi:hypothetical protein|nr:phospholipase D-like domain-containing protein [Oscillospiraceae bacterium]
MLKTISNPFRKDFMSYCANAKKSISLCAPFVKQDVINDILSYKRPDVSVTLVTKISIESFHRKASDCSVLQSLLKSGNCIYNVSNLHAKIYIFDDMKCYITSANLTSNGFERNYEYGIVTDESTILKSATASYKGLVSDNQTGKINIEHIKEIEKILSSIPIHQKLQYPKLRLKLDNDKSPIRNNLTGWKLAVFNALDAQDNSDFDISTANAIASQLGVLFPNNNNREAKVRQVLQQLRDIGLVQFVAPGKYTKLWE